MSSSDPDPTAAAGGAEAAAVCPICCARLPSAAVLSAHMATHSKDEIVSELLRKTAQQAQNITVPDMAAAQGRFSTELLCLKIFCLRR